MNNRYLVFINPTYYPSPGMYGCKAKLSTIDDVLAFILKYKSEDDDGGAYMDYVQFYDVVDDISYSVDIDEIKDNNVVKYEKSIENPYL